jgi:twitching motility protein PilT
MQELQDLLSKMIEVKASDVFINAGLPLAYQASGIHYRTDGDPLTPADAKTYVTGIYELAHRDISIFEDAINHDDDFSFAIPGVGRFRANIFRQRGSYGAVIRVIPFGLPNAEEMNIPPVVMDLAETTKGLVLVTGPAGSGKSTTLACLLDRMNHERSGHIITMEDPIEYVHKHGECIITQREVPTDIATYSEALRSAMRESPDVILLGEMRDASTIGTAMNAAEMAQLVLSTLHTTSAADTVERIVDAFPANQQRQIRIQLSMVLQAVVCQQLVPTVDGHTIPVFEIMVMNTAIRNLIREEKTYQIDSVIASNGKSGMQTMDQGLYAACKEGKISKEVALRYANHQEALLRRFDAEGL